MTKRLTAAVLILLLLTGCAAKSSSGGRFVVARITVIQSQDGLLTEKAFTSQQKMGQILNLLRSLGQQFTPPLDPDTLPEESIHIHVQFQDGSTRVYQTKSDLYIRTDHSPWQQADRGQLVKLRQLLQELASDE